MTDRRVGRSLTLAGRRDLRAREAMARAISVRELRNTRSEVWEALTHDGLVLSSNGEPLAMLVRIEGADV